MKNLHQSKTLLLFIFTFSSFTFINATNYYTISDGGWDDGNIWSPSRSGEVESGDSVFILHNIDIDDDLEINGVLVIQSGGEIGGNKNIKVNGSGGLVNNGTISTNKAVQVNGDLYNNGTIDVKSVTVTGYLNNTGTISTGNNQKIDINGGTLEGGGSIITDEILIRNGGTISDISICQSGGSDPTFDLQGGTIDSASVVVCGLALPVELYTYEVKVEDNNVLIEWSTASELNNDYFVVERSLDAIHFEEIGREEGASNSYGFRYYAITDRFPFEGISYYRLKQVDNNGTATYFAIKTVENNDGYTDENGLTVYPNPIMEHSKFSIGLAGFGGNSVQVKIQNMNGLLVYADEINVLQERELIELETNIIQDAGMYVVSILKGNRWYHHKFMVIK